MANSGSKSTREILLELIEAKPGITREGLLGASGLPSGAVDPSRIRLWKAGLIEPTDEEGWRDALENKIKNVGWRAVEDTARQAEVRGRAKERTERNAEPTAEEMAIKIVESLKDPVVAKLVEEMSKEGTGSRRAQRRTAKALRAQEQERKREASQAEREKMADASFKRNLARLWEARGAVGAIDQFLVEERARVAKGDQRRISDVDWILALNDARSIIKSFGAMWQNLRDIGGRNEPCPACGAVQIEPARALGTFVIDVEAISEEVVPDAEVAS
jgi:hypothetical protein